MTARKSRKKVLGFVAILLGVLLPLVPVTTIAYNQLNKENRYADYRGQALSVDTAQVEQEVQEYNARTQPEVERQPVDPFFNERYDTEYGVDVSATDDVFAFLNIPSIDVMLPVFLGATDDHLARGAAHVDGTALPVGGKDQRSVIAGHFGWAGDIMFLNLGEVQEGDPVLLERDGEVLLYRVRDLQVIDANDFESLRPEVGKDMITLLTCWPAPPFPERLLVNCERVEVESRIVGQFDDPVSLKTEDSEEPIVPEVADMTPPARVRTVQWGAYAFTAVGWVYFLYTAVRFGKYLVKK